VELGQLQAEPLTRQREWPKTARGLSGELKRIAPSLRAVGIDVSFPKRQAHIRPIEVRLVPDEPSSSSPPSPPPADDANKGTTRDDDSGAGARHPRPSDGVVTDGSGAIVTRSAGCGAPPLGSSSSEGDDSDDGVGPVASPDESSAQSERTLTLFGSEPGEMEL
jgi:hypothetical protein